MKIDQTALYVKDLEATAAFYQTYFGATAGKRYHNPRTGLMTYFLSFGEGSRLKLMTRADHRKELTTGHLGWHHVALTLGSEQAVDELTDRLRDHGYAVVSGPSTTGDGYYESCVLDAGDNQVELVA